MHDSRKSIQEIFNELVELGERDSIDGFKEKAKKISLFQNLILFANYLSSCKEVSLATLRLSLDTFLEERRFDLLIFMIKRYQMSLDSIYKGNFETKCYKVMLECISRNQNLKHIPELYFYMTGQKGVALQSIATIRKNLTKIIEMNARKHEMIAIQQGLAQGTVSQSYFNDRLTNAIVILASPSERKPVSLASEVIKSCFYAFHIGCFLVDPWEVFDEAKHIDTFVDILCYEELFINEDFHIYVSYLICTQAYSMYYQLFRGVDSKSLFKDYKRLERLVSRLGQLVKLNKEKHEQYIGPEVKRLFQGLQKCFSTENKFNQHIALCEAFTEVLDLGFDRGNRALTEKYLDCLKLLFNVRNIRKDIGGIDALLSHFERLIEEVDDGVYLLPDFIGVERTILYKKELQTKIQFIFINQSFVSSDEGLKREFLCAAFWCYAKKCTVRSKWQVRAFLDDHIAYLDEVVLDIILNKDSYSEFKDLLIRKTVIYFLEKKIPYIRQKLNDGTLTVQDLYQFSENSSFDLSGYHLLNRVIGNNPELDIESIIISWYSNVPIRNHIISQYQFSLSTLASLFLKGYITLVFLIIRKEIASCFTINKKDKPVGSQSFKNSVVVTSHNSSWQLSQANVVQRRI